MVVDFSTVIITSFQIAVIIVIVIIVIVKIAIIIYCINKRKSIGSQVQTVVGQPLANLAAVVCRPPMPAPMVHFHNLDSPSMEKFFQNLANEKPVRFTAQQLHAFTSNYANKLGSGGFGNVYSGYLRNDIRIAVKVLNKSSDQTAEEQFMAEVGTIGKTYHRNLVKLYGFCFDHSMSALVYEYMENGSLDRYLFRDDVSEPLGFDKIHEIAIGTARGIAYLHEECEQMIIHYDIKPANILLNANFIPKVADFGLAKLCSRDNTHVSLQGGRGTPGYLAPELHWHNYPITHKCDVYSFGMLLFEMIGKKRNFQRPMNSCYGGSLYWFPKQVWDNYKEGHLDALILGRGIEEKNLDRGRRMSMIALWCAQDSPDDRPPMSVVVKMLEGVVEVLPPPKPFAHLYSSAINIFDQSNETTESSTSSTSGNGSSKWYKETAPLMKRAEIATK